MVTEILFDFNYGKIFEEKEKCMLYDKDFYLFFVDIIYGREILF